MKTLLTGAGGQLGQELRRSAPSTCDLTACVSADLDITDQDSVHRKFDEIEPDLVINAAAYTAVDRAEQERNQAFRVNADGARNVSRAAASRGARVIHISTDFVFDGNRGRPYRPLDPANPQSVYGESKRRGEEYVAEATDGAALILRTAWLYSRFGSNFVTAMLARMRDGRQLEIVADQIGTPTWASGLAKAIWLAAATTHLQGILHWTDAGVASWYDFAVAIQEEALSCGLLDEPVAISPIETRDYPTPARRPPYSVLDKSATWSSLAIHPQHWRIALRSMLTELGNSENA